MKYKVKVYEDKQHEWRLRVVGRNGKIVLDGAEGYSTRTGAMRAVRTLAMRGIELIEAFSATANLDEKCEA